MVSQGMMNRLLILGLLAATLTSSAFAQISIDVAGLRIVTKGHKAGDNEIRAFNWSKGTSVALLILSEGKSIVKLDEEASTFTAFSDDKGTDLLKTKSRFSNKAVQFSMAKIAEGGKALGVSVETEGLPAKGAMSLTLKGELAVSVASKSELKKSAELIVKEGESFELNGQEIKIKTAEKPKWGDDELDLTIVSKKSLKDYKSVIFYDAAGKKVKFKRKGSSWGGFNGNMSYSLTLGFEKKHQKLVMGAEIWTDLEAVKVPLDQKIGVGL